MRRLLKAMNKLPIRSRLLDAAHFLRNLSPGMDILDIEIAHCNLSCAMCPRNPEFKLDNPSKGLMEPGLFRRIIDKTVEEKVHFRNLWFGNWGESLLNPGFPGMVEYARARLPRTKIILFTNLTCLPDADAVARSGLDAMFVSVSGMTQEVYGRNHIGGKIDAVLANLLKMRDARQKARSRLRLVLRYHEYIYNREEGQAAQKFCRDNGLEFEPLRCYIPCVEESVRFATDPGRKDYYRRFIDVDAEARSFMRPLGDPRKCWLLNKSVTVNFDGRLYRCCAVYDQKYFLGSFFDHPIRAIKDIRSPICEACAKVPTGWRV